MGQPLKDPRKEREAYYRRIAPAHLTPLWEMMSALVPRQPMSPLCARAVEIRRGAAVADGVRQSDHGEGSDTPRADP